MRDESRTLDFRLKFVPTGKEELENLRFIPAVNVTEKPQLENAPSVKLVTETVICVCKVLADRPIHPPRRARESWPWARRLIYRSGHLSRGLRTCVPCRIHVTRFAFLLSNSNHDAAIVMSTNEVAVGAGRRRLAFSFSKGPVLRRPSLGIEQEVAAHHTAQAWQRLWQNRATLLYIPGSAGALVALPAAAWRISRRQATAQRERAGRSVLRSKHRA